MSSALICIDFQKDIIHPDGKLAAKGYADFAARHATLQRVAELQHYYRRQQQPVIHVHVGFSEGYPEQPLQSPVFSQAQQYGVLQLGSWGTEFVKETAPLPGEAIITKHRVSAFYQTPLALLLRNQGIGILYFCGVSTDMGVETSARDAHDRDFRVNVVADACAAASDEEHQRSLSALAKIGRVMDVADVTAG